MSDEIVSDEKLEPPLDTPADGGGDVQVAKDARDWEQFAEDLAKEHEQKDAAYREQIGAMEAALADAARELDGSTAMLKESGQALEAARQEMEKKDAELAGLRRIMGQAGLVEVDPQDNEPAAPPKKYRVLNSRCVSVGGGAMSNINEGDVLDEAGYGTAGIQSLRDQGVQLQEM